MSTPAHEATVLWEPPEQLVEEAALTRYLRWLERERGLAFDGYEALWRWSVTDLDAFWRSIWDVFEVHGNPAPGRVLGDRSMPGAQWFPGTHLNFAEHVFRGKADDAVAIVHASELRDQQEMSWAELRALTGRVAAGLRALGVGKGDRVVAYMPNVPETVAAFLACATLGAVWSTAAPEFGAGSVIDRFAQIEPKVLLAVDGYRYGGRDFDRRETVARLRDELPGLEHTVLLPYLDPEAQLPGAMPFDELLASGDNTATRFEPVPFDHPLWVLYSSGTTGLPKAIVQGQGGILLEHLKTMHLHLDAQPGDRVLWFTTTGWMMWNFLVGVLLTDAAIVLFDGNPAYPDMGTLWDLAERAEVTTFGTSAAYIATCMKEGVRPAQGRDLSRLRAIGSTGSPLSPEGFDWVYGELGPDTWLFSTSGGTDVCTAFVGGVPLLPVHRGEIQARALGCAVEARDEEGRSVIDEVGELVITQPMPSMPLYLWDDPEGRRLRESYFDTFPGVWRHGDWVQITSRGTAVIYGRSDSTINRGGVRMGTSEIYRAVLAVEEVVDALVVDVPDGEGGTWMPLFVVLREGLELDDDLAKAIGTRIREDCSPRHVPDEVRQIAAVPRTLSGKVLEVPVKAILMGQDPESAASRESLANPEALDAFVAMADRKP
ncbi:MAG: acetoacetate--CoA ligase [Actinomycetota bacterium]|jgi:acetoacetyl-CoA synthetase|nr:acetoacetate--CoA ligase [Solirubrobacterales bacterium]MDQ3371884.1 acetoacetate--CoA ligase [Actinomycetota bacterium]MDQ3409429.1 acetoacetate--CoA ligase [Actinomycetota bacterium]